VVLVDAWRVVMVVVLVRVTMRRKRNLTHTMNRTMHASTTTFMGGEGVSGKMGEGCCRHFVVLRARRVSRERWKSRGTTAAWLVFLAAVIAGLPAQGRRGRRRGRRVMSVMLEERQGSVGVCRGGHCCGLMC
jgi:hypothetical protein